jgi:hypothetical protein
MVWPTSLVLANGKFLTQACLQVIAYCPPGSGLVVGNPSNQLAPRSAADEALFQKSSLETRIWTIKSEIGEIDVELHEHRQRCALKLQKHRQRCFIKRCTTTGRGGPPGCRGAARLPYGIGSVCCSLEMRILTLKLKIGEINFELHEHRRRCAIGVSWCTPCRAAPSRCSPGISWRHWQRPLMLYVVAVRTC